jgi:hypothetical protein
MGNVRRLPLVSDAKAEPVPGSHERHQRLMHILYDEDLTQEERDTFRHYFTAALSNYVNDKAWDAGLRDCSNMINEDRAYRERKKAEQDGES